MLARLNPLASPSLHKAEGCISCRSSKDTVDLSPTTRMSNFASRTCVVPVQTEPSNHPVVWRFQPAKMHQLNLCKRKNDMGLHYPSTPVSKHRSFIGRVDKLVY
ncbi:uncharacterized protein [Anabrus simplex]|uniref:uncharacterized protein n=1 Tax=Anabrus simplex TaxID=316456 RepID=UPI0035A3A65E